jgi:hypothetical protein
VNTLYGGFVSEVPMDRNVDEEELMQSGGIAKERRWGLVGHGALSCLLACGSGGTPASDGSVVADISDASRPECMGEAGLVTVSAAPGDIIVFHDEGGAVLASEVISDSLSINYAVPPCAQITAAHSYRGAMTEAMLTVTDVMPGDHIHFGRGPYDEADYRIASITYPSIGAQSFTFMTGYYCGRGGVTIEYPVLVGVSQRCYLGQLFNLVAIAHASVGPRFAIIEDVPLGEMGDTIELTIDEWRNDFATVEVSATSPPGATWSSGLVIPIKGEQGYTYLNWGDFNSLPHTASYPPIGDALLVSVYAGTSQTQVHAFDVLSPPPESYSVDFESRIPFQITQFNTDFMSRPTMTWASASSEADVTVVCAEWLELKPYGRWCVHVNPTRRAVRFPEVPAGMWPARPAEDQSIYTVGSSLVGSYASARLLPMGTGSFDLPTGYRGQAAFRGHIRSPTWQLE